MQELSEMWQPQAGNLFVTAPLSITFLFCPSNLYKLGIVDTQDEWSFKINCPFNLEILILFIGMAVHEKVSDWGSWKSQAVLKTHSGSAASQANLFSCGHVHVVCTTLLTTFLCSCSYAIQMSNIIVTVLCIKFPKKNTSCLHGCSLACFMNFVLCLGIKNISVVKCFIILLSLDFHPFFSYVLMHEHVIVL